MTFAPPDKEYFSIGEASEITRVAPYVMRYWESEFKLLRPSRRDSGQRRYSRKDLETILKIKDLLYVKKFTIPGAKKHLADAQRKGAEQVVMELKEAQPASELLNETKKVLEDILTVLK